MSRMTGYEAFSLFRALKMHFTSKYNFHQYSGRLGTKAQYEKNNGKYFFDKIAMKYEEDDLKFVFVANLLENSNVWIKTIASDEGHHIYLAWCKRNFNLTKSFENDLTYINGMCNNKHIKYNDVFVSPEKEHPIIIELVLNNCVNIETFCILDDIMNITPFLNRDLQGDPIWDTFKSKVWNYKGFINYDKNKLISIVKNIFKA